MSAISKIISHFRYYYQINRYQKEFDYEIPSPIDLGLPGKIYLTSVDRFTENIESFKVSGIISLARPPKVYTDRMHLLFDISDNESKETVDKMSDIFNVALPLIHEILTEGKNVLIHCLAGCSRAPTLVIAYLMKYHFSHLADKERKLYECAIFVHRCRPCIFPSNAFLNLLKSYDFS